MKKIIIAASTATTTTVASSATNVTLLSANSNRISCSIQNESSAILYVKFGATATTSSYKVQIAANTHYQLPFPCYTGRIDGIWASANGNARISEEVI